MSYAQTLEPSINQRKYHFFTCSNSYLNFFRSFTRDDIRVHINPEDRSVRFVVVDPDNPDSPISASQIREAINGDFKSKVLGLSVSIESDDEKQWPLIVGLSIGAAIVILVVVFVIV